MAAVDRNRDERPRAWQGEWPREDLGRQEAVRLAARAPVIGRVALVILAQSIGAVTGAVPLHGVVAHGAAYGHLQKEHHHWAR